VHVLVLIIEWCMYLILCVCVRRLVWRKTIGNICL